MHLVGFIIRIYHDARSPERQTEQGILKISNFSFICTSPNIRQFQVKLFLSNTVVFLFLGSVCSTFLYFSAFPLQFAGYSLLQFVTV